MKHYVVLPVLIIAVLVSSGCINQIQPEKEFILPESFITMQGPILAVTLSGCDKGYVGSEVVIDSDECEKFNNLAPCIRIPLSLIDYNWTYYEQTGKYRHFSNELECDGVRNKAQCQIKMDNEILVKEGCFETGLGAITTYSKKSTKIDKTHTFTVCCSATDKKEGFDTCKSYTMGRVCPEIELGFCAKSQLVISEAVYDSESKELTLSIFNTGDVLLSGFVVTPNYQNGTIYSTRFENLEIYNQEIKTVTLSTDSTLKQVAVKSLQCGGTEDLINRNNIQGL
ncbi:MAG: hypothetical protein GTN76_02830 [Candidatus Aenigmarchaeota archaeon]|nr:hypothetical protein [Candidatus Aenigmarchaeota archaeon]